MRNLFTAVLLLLIAGVCLVNCKKEVEKLNYESYTPFSPLVVGKYITYRLDSTVTKSFGTGFDVHTYTIKDSVEGQFLDNLNRLSYRIFRYQLSGNQWIAINTFSATPTGYSLEYVENNLRMLKLVNPITSNENWQGNSSISMSPFFVNSDYTSWTYSYADIDQPFTENNQTFDSTLTVMSHDSLANNSFYYKQYSSFAKGYEVYAKNIGKVYQDILNWEYQAFTTLSNCRRVYCAGNQCDTTSLDCNLTNCDSIRKLAGNSITCDTVLTNYYYDGYGVKLTMIDHN